MRHVFAVASQVFQALGRLLENLEREQREGFPKGDGVP